MKQTLTLSSNDLARLKRRENSGYNLYSPIFIGDRAVALAKFMAEGETPTGTLEMALAEKAEDAELPLFYIRHDPDFTRFHVSPGNLLAGTYVPTTKMLNEDGLAGLFTYCGTRQ